MNTRTLGVAALAVVASLAGCAGSDGAASTGAGGMAVVDDQYSSQRAHMAPVVKGKSSETGVSYSARLAASESKETGVVANTLYVEFTYSNNRWLFISSAALPGGKPLAVVQNDRLVDDCRPTTGFCNYTERMTALLPLDVLAGAKEGLKVSFQGTVVELPADYVLGYLQDLSASLK